MDYKFHSRLNYKPRDSQKIVTNIDVKNKKHTRSLLSPDFEYEKDSTSSVANCIRGLNFTIEALTKENASLKKTIHDSANQNFDKMKNCETEPKTKQLQDINERLVIQVKELNEQNLELQEKYFRVKQMYDILADKQKNSEKIKNPAKASENSQLRQKNKKLAEINQKYLTEIESLKSKISLLQTKVLELEEHKTTFIEQTKKSENYVNEISEINDQLLNYIKAKSTPNLRLDLKSPDHSARSLASKIDNINTKYQEFSTHELSDSPLINPKSAKVSANKKKTLTDKARLKHQKNEEKV